MSKIGIRIGATTASKEGSSSVDSAVMSGVMSSVEGKGVLQRNAQKYPTNAVGIATTIPKSMTRPIFASKAAAAARGPGVGGINT